MPSRHVRRMRRAIGGTSERQLSKEQVLGLYLTLAPLGGNLEGVRAASLAYFREKNRRCGCVGLENPATTIGVGSQSDAMTPVRVL